MLLGEAGQHHSALTTFISRANSSRKPKGLEACWRGIGGLIWLEQRCTTLACPAARGRGEEGQGRQSPDRAFPLQCPEHVCGLEALGGIGHQPAAIMPERWKQGGVCSPCPWGSADCPPLLAQWCARRQDLVLALHCEGL